MKKIIYLLFILKFITASGTFADEINIASDKLNVDRDKNISIFSGNVYASNDNLEIWSEKLTVKSNRENKEINEIIAESNVKIVKDEMTVLGDKGLYFPETNKLNVIGNIQVNNNGNIIHCDELTVDLEESISIMKSTSSNRVEAVIVLEDS